MSTFLPQDANNYPIPALRLKNGAAHAISATATSARNSTAFDGDTRIISLYATSPVFVKFGDSSVTATTSDHYFPAGVYYDLSIGGDTTAQYGYVAVLAADTDGTVYVSEKE
ncbi:MAG: hypothetical protein KDJ35_07655 [Alphaproteobacteria bacterium]|nr:hypothetical protein [Alphaproteobacteria bacterium]